MFSSYIHTDILGGGLLLSSFVLGLERVRHWQLKTLIIQQRARENQSEHNLFRDISFAADIFVGINRNINVPEIHSPAIERI